MTQQSNSNLRLGMTFMASIVVIGFNTTFNRAIKDQVQPAFDLKINVMQTSPSLF